MPLATGDAPRRSGAASLSYDVLAHRTGVPGLPRRRAVCSARLARPPRLLAGRPGRLLLPGGRPVGTRLPVGWGDLHLSWRRGRARGLWRGAGLDLRPARRTVPRRIRLGAMASDTSDKYMLARITRRQDYSPTLWAVWMKPPAALGC